MRESNIHKAKMLSDGKLQSLQLQQDHTHFSSLPSKDNSSSSMVMATSSSPRSSFRSVYYGVASAGAVPFLWELQPGTPKYTFCDPAVHDTITISTTTTANIITTTPPLTPPPSYFSTSNQKTKSNEKKTSSKKHKILNSISPKMRINAAASIMHSQACNVPLSSLSSSPTTTRTKSSSPSSCSSTRTSTPLSFYLRNRFSSPRSSFDSRGDDGDVKFGSPTSTLCTPSNRRTVGDELLFRGCYSMMKMKKALLSIVGISSNGSSAEPSPTTIAA